MATYNDNKLQLLQSPSMNFNVYLHATNLGVYYVRHILTSHVTTLDCIDFQHEHAMITQSFEIPMSLKVNKLL